MARAAFGGLMGLGGCGVAAKLLLPKHAPPGADAGVESRYEWRPPPENQWRLWWPEARLLRESVRAMAGGAVEAPVAFSCPLRLCFSAEAEATVLDFRPQRRVWEGVGTVYVQRIALAGAWAEPSR